MGGGPWDSQSWVDIIALLYNTEEPSKFSSFKSQQIPGTIIWWERIFDNGDNK